MRARLASLASGRGVHSGVSFLLKPNPAAAAMSSVESLREFISERLDAAAERILARYERTVEEYEERTERRRRQTDFSWSPQVQLPASVLRQDSMNTDEEERSSGVKQEVAEASQVKDEEEELSIAQDEEQLDLKQEADAVMKTPEEE